MKLGFLELAELSRQRKPGSSVASHIFAVQAH